MWMKWGTRSRVSGFGRFDTILRCLCSFLASIHDASRRENEHQLT